MKPFKNYEESRAAKTVYELRDEAAKAIKRQIPCTDYLTKSKHGNYICPFCGSGTGANKSGALKYHEDENRVYCFSCRNAGSSNLSFAGIEEGKHADVISLYQVINNLDYDSALRQLSAQLNLPLTPEEYIAQNATRTTSHENTPKTDGTHLNDNLSTNDKKTAKNANKERTEVCEEKDYTEYYKFCAAYLKGDNGQEGRAYLESRGISLELASKYWIGFDPKSDPANAPGRFTGDKPCPVKRIILPTSKIHYVGRRIDGEKKFEKMNPQGATPDIFNHKALKAGNVVFVMEGIFDALSVMECINQDGVEAVALNSTSNRERLFKRLENLKDADGLKLVLCGDNDESGTKMNHELSEKLRVLKIQHTIANICNGYKDANEALTKDRDLLTDSIRKAIQDVKSLDSNNKGDTQEENENSNLSFIGNETPQDGADATPKKDKLDAFFESVQKKSSSIKTGFRWFDELTGGIRRQTLTIVMAAPSAGKTTLCQQIAEALASKGEQIYFLNLEMSNNQMIAKALSSRMTVNPNQKIRMSLNQILDGYKWTEAQRKAVQMEIDAYRRNGAYNIEYAQDGASASLTNLVKNLEEIGETAKKEGRQAPGVVLDYLHLLTADKITDEKTLIKKAITELKRYAIKYDTFVIAISATNRDSNKDGQLDLFSGRDSSNIEYTGDYVLTLDYKAVASGKVKRSDKQELERIKGQPNISMWLNLEKNRFGARGKGVHIVFNPAYNRFFGKDDFIPADGENNPFNDATTKKNIPTI